MSEKKCDDRLVDVLISNADYKTANALAGFAGYDNPIAYLEGLVHCELARRVKLISNCPAYPEWDAQESFSPHPSSKNIYNIKYSREEEIREEGSVRGEGKREEETERPIRISGTNRDTRKSLALAMRDDGKSIGEIATATGVPKQTVSRWLKPDDKPSGIIVPLSGDGEYDIPSSLITKFREVYPLVDVDAELGKLVAWNMANPTKRKTKRGIARHINQWLSRAEERANDKPHVTTPASSTLYDPSNDPAYEDWLKKTSGQ